jgi:hypothetical protein
MLSAFTSCLIKRTQFEKKNKKFLMDLKVFLQEKKKVVDYLIFRLKQKGQVDASFFILTKK